MEAIIVTIFLKVEQNSHGFNNRFHFKGSFMGTSIKEILLHSKESFVRNEEYILHVKVLKVEGSKIYGNILRSKNIK